MRIHIILLLLVPVLSFGQIQYNSSDLGGPGSIRLYNRFLNPSEEMGLSLAGEERVWDVSGTFQLNTHPSSFITPSEGIDQVTFLTFCALGGNSILNCISIWGGTNQAWQLDDTMTLLQATLVDLQRYQKKSNNRLEETFFGFKVDLQGALTPAVVVYNTPDTILNFPIQFGDSWTSSTSWSLDLGATGQDIAYESSQTRQAEVDAWGMIITPFDTFPNTIRVRSIIHRTDSIVTDQGVFPVELKQVEYMWFDTAYEMPVMIANGLATDTADILITVEYIYEATCEDPDWLLLATPTSYFLDEEGEAIVEFPVTNGNVTAIYWNFGDGSTTESLGGIAHRYTAPGIYTITARGCVEDCLPLNTCVTYTTQIEIIDTTVSIPFLNVDEAGFRFLPNPARDYVIVQIPDNIESVQFSIFDLNGKLIDRGVLSGDFGTINIESYPSGILPVMLEWNENAFPVRSMYRIVKTGLH